MDNFNLKDKKSDVTSRIKKLKEQKQDLTEITNNLKNQKQTLERQKEELEQKLQEKSHRRAELEQQKIILNTVSTSLENKTQELEKFSNNLEQKLQQKDHDHAESEQAKMFLKDTMKTESKKKYALQRKYYVAIAVAAIVSSIITVGFFYYESTKSIETEKILEQALKTREPLIQNLKGDIVNTWISWRKKSGDTLYVSIANAHDFPEDKINAVKDAILSLQTENIDDSLLGKGPSGSSTYYKGWEGALKNAAKKSTEFYIPAKIEFVEKKGSGDITIELTNKKDPDGYSGFTNPIVNSNQILMSHITIYEVDKLSDDRLKALVRHEFGHAIGLAHSTATEDLMAPVIKTGIQYISDCDIDAIQTLYDGNQHSKVECEK